jgi:hypothetical protein
MADIDELLPVVSTTEARRIQNEYFQARLQEAKRKMLNNGVPPRSAEQRTEALGQANRIRTKRADLKKALKVGNADIIQLIMEPPTYIETMKIYDLMLAVPKYGHVKVDKVLRMCRISPSKTVGGLSERQRVEIITYLR